MADVFQPPNLKETLNTNLPLTSKCHITRPEGTYFCILRRPLLWREIYSNSYLLPLNLSLPNLFYFSIRYLNSTFVLASENRVFKKPQAFLNSTIINFSDDKLTLLPCSYTGSDNSSSSSINSKPSILGPLASLKLIALQKIINHVHGTYILLREDRGRREGRGRALHTYAVAYPDVGAFMCTHSRMWNYFKENTVAHSHSQFHTLFLFTLMPAKISSSHQHVACVRWVSKEQLPVLCRDQVSFLDTDGARSSSL